MLDLMWSGVAQYFSEVMKVTIWLLPRLYRFVATIANQIFSLSMLSTLTIVTGWKHVANELTADWVQKGWEAYYITPYNERWLTGLLRIGAHLAIFSGYLLNAFIVCFTVWFTGDYFVQLLSLR